MPRIRLPSCLRRVRHIPQLEVAECGAAALAMVLDFHGAAVPLAEVREACGVGRDGMDAARIVRAAARYQLEASGFRLDPEHLHELPLPAILHWEFNHFVVLERVRKKGAAIVDPACGRREVSFAELGRAFTGVALAFAPSPEFVLRRPSSPSLGRYRRALLAQLGPLGLVLGSALLLELFAISLPAATQVMIDHVMVPSRERWLWPIAAAFTLASLAVLALGGLRDRVLRRLSFALDVELVTRFLAHMLTLPLPFFQQRATGDLLQRAEAQRQMRDVTMRATSALLDGLLVLSYGGLMLAYDVTLGGIAVALSVVRILVLLLFRGPVQRAVASELAQRGRELGAAVDALGVPEVVKAFGAEDAMLARYDGKLAERLNTTVERERLTSTASQASGLVDALIQACILWLGGTAVIEQRMTLGVFASFVTLQGIFQKPLSSVVDALFELTYARGALARIDDVLEATPAPAGERVLTAMARGITFEGVSFRYGPASPWICRDLELCIAAGEKVAIVGRSGQGKSTFLKLLLGMLEPSEGQVAIDGVPLPELEPCSLRRAVGVVLQEPFLFDDSVRANLTLHADDVPHAIVSWAARTACIDDAIERLPEGYETRIGENGSRLSGGQRQRLALARALCRRPSLLVLDEATSSLDRETEARVHENLASIGCTRVVIAHRLATVRDADRILVFEGGRIVQEGTYAQLIRVPGVFQQLATALA